ncbi:hsp70-like protein [Aureobasidium pullulans]|nr:hsp70-like protein [Aureobasidium pullulans]THW94614.1 hsp70-like protein [Aureobasidium pullulans]THY85461.1 hsp70-like protein [Aureobasidium pullulans]THZ89194.1 hsp70-like protein [Aureobasidium pullulans]
MNDPGLNTLLKWSIENSAVSETAEPTQPRTQLNPELLAQLMGGPSDADRMISSMQAIHDPSVDHENKGIAWDNFEQLVENLDNANNMEALKLWTPLVEKLESEETQDREMACWCLGTAVQNNIKCQERALAVGAIPKVAKLCSDPDAGVRKKAIRVISSEVRNYQPALDEAVKYLPEEIVGDGKFDAEDMASVDIVVNGLRERSAKMA